MFFRGTPWTVQDVALSSVLPDLDSAGQVNGQLVRAGKQTDLLQFEQQGKPYFIKRYWRAGKGLRAYLGRSRARAEWENLQYFKQMALPAPLVLAYGEDRALSGAYRMGAFVMSALPGVEPLDRALAAGLLAQPTLRWHVLKQIAIGLRRLHQTGFVHGDAYVRNFLIQPSTEFLVYFTDCPQGRRWWRLRQWYGQWRDIRCFFKGLSVSKADKRRFLAWYTGRAKLSRLERGLLAYMLRPWFF